MNSNQPGRTWSRRDFLTRSAAGTGLLIGTQFLLDCGGTQPKSIASAASEIRDKGFFGRFGIDAASARKVLDRALFRAGNYANLFFQYRRTNWVAVQDGEVNRASCDVSLGCGVRVLVGDQTGFAFTEDLSLEALLSAADTASAVAKTGKRSLSALEEIAAPNFSPIEVPWNTIGVDQKMPFVAQADKVCRAYDPRIVKVSAAISDTTSHVLIATSDGQLIEDYQPMTEVYVNCVAEAKGRKENNGWAFGVRRGFEFYSPTKIEELAKEAGSRTVRLFEASPPPAGEYPVVLAAGQSGILLHEAMGHGFEADFNRKGTSVYANRIGQRVAPELVTIIDDGTNPHERGTIDVDDEGNKSQRTVLVDKGVLTSYLHDRISSAHYKVPSTGNGRRESYRFPPVPRMRNTYMLAGPHKKEEIIASVKQGIYAETFTNGQVDIGAGDFAFYLKDGYLIENGKLTRPIKDANLVGFGPKVLEKVSMVADDMQLYSGPGYCGKDGQQVAVGFGLPTIKCGGISVGGAS